MKKNLLTILASVIFALTGYATTTSETIQFLGVNPAEGAVTSLSKIIIETDTDLHYAVGLTLTDAQGNSYGIKYTNVDLYEQSIYAYITVVLAEEITAPGVYTLTIPAGGVVEYEGTKTNTEQAYTWTIGDVPQEPTITTTTPAQGSTITEPLTEILATWNINVDISFGGQEAYILDAEGNKVTTARAEYVYDTNHACIDNQLNFVLDTPIETAYGNYTFVIEAGYVNDMGTATMANKEIRIEYFLNINSGIDSITADATNGYMVYDINGILVMHTANAADLDRLDKGVYIINGVKVFINR